MRALNENKTFTKLSPMGLRRMLAMAEGGSVAAGSSGAGISSPGIGTINPVNMVAEPGGAGIVTGPGLPTVNGAPAVLAPVGGMPNGGGIFSTAGTVAVAAGSGDASREEAESARRSKRTRGREGGASGGSGEGKGPVNAFGSPAAGPGGAGNGGGLDKEFMDQMKRFMKMSRGVGGSGKGLPGDNKENTSPRVVLDEKYFRRVDKFNGDVQKLRGWMFDLLVAIGQVDKDLAKKGSKRC